jgi:hypothetical protein
LSNRLELLGIASAIPGYEMCIAEMQEKLKQMRIQLRDANGIPEATISPVHEPETEPDEPVEVDTKSNSVQGQKSYWARMTPAKRKAEIARRAKKRLQTMRRNGN